MSRTRQELRFKALAIVLGGNVGQPPSDEDATAIDGYINDVLEELTAKSIVYIPDADDIPNELFGNVAKLVANSAAEEFGGKMDPNIQAVAERDLRIIARQMPGYGPQQTSYF